MSSVTAADRHDMPHYEVPEDVDPLAVLLAEREEDDRRMPATARAEGLSARAPGMAD
ncbi:hypothetical protein [Streptomyces sp. NRRL S-37]|uniref:hypothetical protein n=1 Tax=Streptomyces sp. NRRL S-37 TaxID=1463903 RepID=UPI00131AB73A|nr:hypothetical protein [Streptomyces sp. NRRL S-37]